jgi:hypothetical protein
MKNSMNKEQAFYVFTYEKIVHEAWWNLSKYLKRADSLPQQRGIGKVYNIAEPGFPWGRLNCSHT